MISIDIGEVINIWGDIFEDKHYIISSIQINLLIFLYCSFNFLLLLIFLHQLFYVDLLHIFLFKLGDSLPLILLLLIIVFLCINQSLINFDTSFIEMTIIIYFQFWCQSINDLLLLFYKRMIIDLSPTYPLFCIYCQTSLDEVFCFLGYVHSRVIWPTIFYTFENLKIAHTLVRIFTIHQLVINDADWPKISFKSVRFLL